MYFKTQKAFTMVELIFAIMIIGILSAVAIPKFARTTVLASDARATSVITSVMSALATERQKRILKGDFANPVTSLGADSNAFSIFNADKDGVQNEVIAIPVANCTSGQTGCWTRSGVTNNIYTYTFADSGSAVFTLANNKIKCTSSATICARLIR